MVNGGIFFIGPNWVVMQMSAERVSHYLNAFVKKYPAYRSEILLGFLAAAILHDQPDLSFDSFDTRLLDTRQRVMQMVRTTQDTIPGKRWFEVRYQIPRVAEAILSRYHRKNDSLETKLDAIQLTIQMVPKWLSMRAITMKPYSFTPAIFPNQHGEAVLGMEIRLNKMVLATMGGYFFFRNKKPTFLNINVQGVPKERVELEKLNQALGTNWRSFYVKKLSEILEQQGYRVAGGHHYLLYGEQLQRSGKRPSYFRQYDQTYRKSGFKPLLGHIPQNRDIWIRPAPRKGKKR